jgi:hypothetical protein
MDMPSIERELSTAEEIVVGRADDGNKKPQFSSAAADENWGALTLSRITVRRAALCPPTNGGPLRAASYMPPCAFSAG